MDWINYLIDFLEQNGIVALFVSIIIAILELVLLFFRTRKSKLEKEFLKLNNFNEADYVAIYNKKEIPLSEITFRKIGGEKYA